MGKKTTKCVCHECDVEFDIVVVGENGKKLVPDICPFCGDVCDLRDERPFLKDFQEYDDFDFDKYYNKDEYEDEEED
jgi:hypothetical protein